MCERSPDRMLIYVRKKEIRFREWSGPPGRTDPSGALGLGHLARDSVLAVDDIRHAQAAVWDSLDDTIFWSDYKSVSVSRSRRDGSEQRVIISTDLGTRPSGERLAWCGRSPVFCF